MPVLRFSVVVPRGPFLAFVLTLCAVTDLPANDCPICGQPTVTLAERNAKADAALLVSWVSAEAPKEGQPASGGTTFEILQIQRDPGDLFEKGKRITLPGYRAGKPGDLLFLLANRDEKKNLKWDEPYLEVTETSFQYVVQAPSPETAAEKRLAYYLRFLEFPDLTIANDAHAEFVNAPTKDISAMGKLMPREKLRKWLFDPKTPINRLAAYGLMLGFCGGAEDARLLEKKIIDPNDERRIGIEGIIAGYLLLTGERGLAVLEKTKLDKSTPVGEVYPAVLALRFIRGYEVAGVSPEKIHQAMRKLLDRPDCAEWAVTDLARWKDWSVQARLMDLYGTKGYDDKGIKKAIIGYMIASKKDVPKDPDAKRPQHAIDGEKNLNRLRERDPKLVEETERFFFLR